MQSGIEGSLEKKTKCISSLKPQGYPHLRDDLPHFAFVVFYFVFVLFAVP